MPSSTDAYKSRSRHQIDNEIFERSRRQHEASGLWRVYGIA
jgi:hypothetical protein